MKISSTAFLRLCEKAKNRNVSDNMMNLLVDLAYRHVLREKWTHGNPCEVFMRDGFPCIRYADGIWFHYDVVKGKWF